MAVQTLRAQITEPGHPLQGAEVSIRWGVDVAEGDEVFVAADVKIRHPSDKWSRWVPVQLVDQWINLNPDPDEAA